MTLSACAAVVGCAHGSGAPAAGEAVEPVEPAVTGTGAEASTPAQAQPAAPAEAPDAAAHMRVSFWSAVRARDALVEGDLEEARRLADALSKQDFSGLPGDWRQSVAEMQKHAGAVAIAAGVDEAAVAIGHLGVACGQCHARNHAAPPAPAPAAEPTAETEQVDQRMARHEAAADAMWHGLIAPGSDSWKLGAITLRDLSPQPPVDEGQSVDPEFTKQLHQIKALGLQALSAASVEAQAEIYGDYLSRCASCHSVTAR